VLKRIALGVAVLVVGAWTALSIAVELEGQYVQQDLGGPGPTKALVLYHPSREANFSDDLSLAVAEGLKAAGFKVDRATITSRTPGTPQGYALVAVVSNTYYWTPDLPTLHYLERARLDGTTVLGLIGGAGSTGRSQRTLHQALRSTGATVLPTHAFWLWRPNDERQTGTANRQVALEQARQLGHETGEALLAGAALSVR
jgi:hypothetical protein